MAPLGQVMQVQTAALRNAIPDLVLRPGMMLAARVAERAGQHGILVLAGLPLVAELPAQIKAGQSLRLAVQEATEERVVLKIVEQPPPTVQAPVSLPLPDGRAAQVRVEEREHGGEGAEGELEALSIVYDSPALGAVEFRMWIGADAVSVAVRARAGAPFALAEGGAGELGAALQASTGRAASVAVTPRHDPLSVYA